MNFAQIENNLQNLIDTFSKETFIYNFLLAYGLPKASITRLQKGNLNLSKTYGEISWKKKLFFKEIFEQDLYISIYELYNEIKHEERFVIVTDYETFLAIDTKTQDKLDIKLKDLPKHYDFFLPWAGREKAQHQNESLADVKAAEKMAKLFDEIKKDNPDNLPEFIHGLNVFLCRLLFCFFAEDTNIFKEGQFTNSVASHTQADGSDLNTYLDRLFEVLNTPENDRQYLPAYLNGFPYVNGGLFKQRFQAPRFTRRSRQAIIDSGELNWSVINPDIFGSMMQAVMTPEHRGDSGIHYTSVPNIMKVIEPLFLNDLKEAYEKAKGNQKKRNELLKRLQTIKIFDPACGSGNFLVIAYKELRRLEMEIFKEQGSALPISGISLEQFYGIELDDFAHEIAQLSLWLAEHQMNVEFFKEFGHTNPTLPLKNSGNIVQGNACRIKWETVCPKKEDDEIYILGNPPYLGGKSQSKDQKEDMEIAFRDVRNFKELDYIACWFMIASKYINQHSRFAFVTTSSVNQGAQVIQLWPLIFDLGLEISFVHLPFLWSNNARSNAAVYVSVIGINHKSENLKTIFKDNFQFKVKNISAYLTTGSNVIVTQRLSSLSRLPQMITGNSPYDNNNLRFDRDEKDKLVNDFPKSEIFVRKLYGSSELLNNNEKWCLWIEDDQKDLAMSIPPIKERIEKTRDFRLTGGDVAKGIANRPHQFRYTHTAKKSQIVIPIVSSERREYIPMGYLNNDSVIISSAAAIYDPEPYIFGILSSKIHNCWIKITAGRLKSDYRYLSALCWNTFPIPSISNSHKQEITQCVFHILEEREKHSEKTLSQLYDPDKMPEGLREAHYLNDLAVERCYRSKPFESDEERLEFLFKLYEKMNAEEQGGGIMCQKDKKTQ